MTIGNWAVIILAWLGTCFCGMAYFVPCQVDVDDDKVIESDELSPPSFLLWMSSILQHENDQPSKFTSSKIHI